MKIIYLIFTIIVLIQVSCSINRIAEVDKIVPNKIIIESIESVNLSEDMSRLSTHEDEVLIKIDVLHNSAEKCEIINRVKTEIKHFTKRGEVVNLNEVIDINDNMNEVLISLIELDEYDSEAKVIQISDSLILEGAFFYETFDIVPIDSLFGYDDFLGIARINLEEGFTKELNQKTIKGMQLFDKFEYVIHYHFQ